MKSQRCVRNMGSRNYYLGRHAKHVGSTSRGLLLHACHRTENAVIKTIPRRQPPGDFIPPGSTGACFGLRDMFAFLLLSITAEMEGKTLGWFVAPCKRYQLAVEQVQFWVATILGNVFQARSPQSDISFPVGSSDGQMGVNTVRRLFAFPQTAQPKIRIRLSGRDAAAVSDRWARLTSELASSPSFSKG